MTKQRAGFANTCTDKHQVRIRWARAEPWGTLQNPTVGAMAPTYVVQNSNHIMRTTRWKRMPPGREELELVLNRWRTGKRQEVG